VGAFRWGGKAATCRYGECRQRSTLEYGSDLKGEARTHISGKRKNGHRLWPHYFRVPVRAGRSWAEHSLATHGAALAYYTVFALSPILVIAVSISGLVFGRDAVEGRVMVQMETLLGHAGASLVQRLLEASYLSGQSGIAIFLGFSSMLLGVTGLFAEMSAAFERIFDAKREYRPVLAALLMDRLRGLAIIIGIGFLLIVSLLASTAIVALGDYLTRGFDPWLKLAGAFQSLVSLAFMTALMLLLYRLLIPVRLPRRILLTGAAVSAVLFEAGKWGIGLYLGRGAVMSTFGAAGSLAVILLWVYYVSLIMLYGAEITRQLYRVHQIARQTSGRITYIRSSKGHARKRSLGSF
jgi:membrane protein